MNQRVIGLKRQTYQPPRSEIINMEIPVVLCVSALFGDTSGSDTEGTENMVIDGVVFP